MSTVQLDHLFVPSHDRIAAARLLARLLDVPWAEQGVIGPFSPVYVNDGLTLAFDQWSGPLPRLHFAFRVAPEVFDAVLGRIQDAGLAYRSLPHGPDDHQIIQMMQTQIQKMAMERDALREDRDRAMGLLTEAQQP